MRNCPNELLTPLTQLLRVGLLRIRHAASEGDAALCIIEADHLHNLPGLIEHFSDELPGFYLSVERPGFLDQLERHVAISTHIQDVRQLEPLWAELERYAHAIDRQKSKEKKPSTRFGKMPENKLFLMRRASGLSHYFSDDQ